MGTNSQDIISQLKSFKQQGLTFYEASERLKQAGYSPAQITDAESKVNYVDTKDTKFVMLVAKAPLSPKAGTDMDKSYQKLGNTLLADKERSTRPFAYIALAIPAFYLGQQIYRLWLHRKFWGGDGDSRYLWFNNVGWILLSGAIGAGIAIVSLKLYFHSKDKRYKEINNNIDNPARK